MFENETKNHLTLDKMGHLKTMKTESVDDVRFTFSKVPKRHRLDTFLIEKSNIDITSSFSQRKKFIGISKLPQRDTMELIFT